MIADDGYGFDPDQITEGEGDHFGLAFMRERIGQIGGKLAIEAQPGAGTRVLLCVPIRERRRRRQHESIARR